MPIERDPDSSSSRSGATLDDDQAKRAQLTTR